MKSAPNCVTTMLVFMARLRMSRAGVALMISVAALFAVLIIFETTDFDREVQRYFFDTTSGQWLWDRDEPISRLLIYDGPKTALILFACGLGAMLWRSRRVKTLYVIRSSLWIALLAMITIPFVASTLKSYTNVACPRSLQEFGGTLPYVRVFDSWPENSRPIQRQRCFPAGHASAGFALLGSVFLLGTRRKKVAVVAFSLCLGWAMGTYKMLIGDHFLSHTLISMLLAWCITCLLSLIIVKRTPATCETDQVRI